MKKHLKTTSKNYQSPVQKISKPTDLELFHQIDMVHKFISKRNNHNKNKNLNKNRSLKIRRDPISFM